MTRQHCNSSCMRERTAGEWAPARGFERPTSGGLRRLALVRADRGRTLPARGRLEESIMDRSAQQTDAPSPLWSWWPLWGGWPWRSFAQPVAAPSVAPDSLTQPILPGWTFGNVITVTERNSSAPETERAIVAEESYGRQLGH